MDTKKIISRASVLMFWALSLLCSVHLPAATPGSSVKLSKEVLLDKIKGGWGGQTIGCTYGGPTEFKYSGIIGDDVKIGWNENSVNGTSTIRRDSTTTSTWTSPSSKFSRKKDWMPL